MNPTEPIFPARPLRLALCADSSPQFLVRALEAELLNRNIPAEVRSWAFAAPQTVLKELQAFNPDWTGLWFCSEAEVLPTLAPLIEKLPGNLFCYTAATCDEGTCGSLALIRPETLRARVLKWNAALVELARTLPRLAVVDLDGLQAQRGRENTFDPRLWAIARVAFAPHAVPELARRTVDVLAARMGHLRKVLVTDLDDTLWDGRIGEVGSEGIDPDAPGFPAYRAWLGKLVSRGILLAAASRNDPEAVQAGLMRLNPLFPTSSFSAIECGWGSKCEMLRQIARRLHVGIDSLVFIDDRPEQRAEVRSELPEVAVPEIPEDPACRVEALARQSLFEAAQITAEDRVRVQTLRDEEQREAAAAACSPEAYIASLRQKLIPEPLTSANVERAAQLTQRCNQFNMRGTRHTAAELLGKRGWLYRLRDRFGELGLISVVVLEGNFIETWALSCRALNRGIEALILEHLRQQGQLIGAYRATPRNTRCRTVYAAHAFPHLPEETP